MKGEVVKKPTVVSVSLLLGCSMAFTGEVRRITLDGKDGAIAPEAEPGKDKIDRIHKVETPQLMLYPSTNKPSRGTVMVSPGGGYKILAVEHEGTNIAKMLNDFGWDVAVLLYHVNEGSKTRDLATADAEKALALIQARGTEFGLETKNIGAMGFSAGGHLSARLAHETASTKPPDFLLLIYPAYLEKDGTLLEEVVPPKIPVFVYVAANDTFKTGAIALDAYNREHGLKCEYHLAPSGGHGFGIKDTLPEGVKDWPDKLRAFLDRVSNRRFK